MDGIASDKVELIFLKELEIDVMFINFFFYQYIKTLLGKTGLINWVHLRNLLKY